MIDYLVDTNILISLFNSELAEPIPDGELGYSIITEIELLSFVGLGQAEETLIRTNLKALSQIPLTASIAEKQSNYVANIALKHLTQCGS